MTYKIIIAGYTICRPEIMSTLPSIPGTEQVHLFKTNSPEYKIIWDGYVEMRESQKTRPCRSGDWMEIKEPEEGEHINQFREAINIFMRFLAGEGRDNCNQVKSIELITEEAAA